MRFRSSISITDRTIPSETSRCTSSMLKLGPCRSGRPATFQEHVHLRSNVLPITLLPTRTRRWALFRDLQFPVAFQHFSHAKKSLRTIFLMGFCFLSFCAVRRQRGPRRAVLCGGFQTKSGGFFTSVHGRPVGHFRGSTLSSCLHIGLTTLTGSRPSPSHRSSSALQGRGMDEHNVSW